MTVEELMEHLSRMPMKDKVYIIRTAWEEDYVDDIESDDLIIGEELFQKAKQEVEF